MVFFLIFQIGDQVKSKTYREEKIILFNKYIDIKKIRVTSLQTSHAWVREEQTYVTKYNHKSIHIYIYLSIWSVRIYYLVSGQKLETANYCYL